MTRNYVPACRQPVLTVMSGCDMDILEVGNCPQMRCNVNRTVSWSNSVPTSLCNKLYADGHVQHWCGSKGPSTVQLLIDTTVLQERVSLSASLSSSPWKHMGAGGMIPHRFKPGTRWRWHEEGNRLKYWLDRRLGGPEMQSWSYSDKKILSHLPRIKPPFLDQPATDFASTLIVLISSYYIKASRTLKNGSLKDCNILKDHNTIFLSYGALLLLH
jgi:hypothetical protein